MAVKAQASITISRLVDISSVTRYYLLQSSTSAAPAKPTTNPALIGKNLFNIDDMYNSPDNSKYEIQDNMLRVYLNRTSVIGCIYRVDLPTGTAYTASYNVSYGGTATGIYNAIDGSTYSGKKMRVTHSGTVSESGYVSLEFSRIGGNNDKLGWVDYSNIQVELGTSATTYQKYVTPNWQLTEPAYTSGSTNTLYFTDCTEFTNGTFKYSEVSKSSSYEAAKEAYNKAAAVETRVTNAETAIEQNKTDITLRATKTEVTTAVDDATNNLQSAMADQKDAIINDCNANITEALDNYVRTGDYEEYKETVTSSLELMAEQIRMDFEETTSSIASVDGDMQTRFTELAKYIRFNIDGIEIGGSEDSLTLRLDNDLIRFEKNGETLGWWDGVDFHTGNIKIDVTERAQFGNFAFVPRSDGSLMFLKVDNVVGEVFCPDLTDVSLTNAIQYEALPGHGIRVYTTAGQTSTAYAMEIEYDHTKKYRITYTSKNAKLTCFGYPSGVYIETPGGPGNLPTLCVNETDGFNTINVDGLFRFQFENVDTSVTEYSIKDMRIVEVN